MAHQKAFQNKVSVMMMIINNAGEVDGIPWRRLCMGRVTDLQGCVLSMTHAIWALQQSNHYVGIVTY